MKTIKRIFVMLAVISAVIFMDACKAEKGEVRSIGFIGATGRTVKNMPDNQPLIIGHVFCFKTINSII